MDYTINRLISNADFKAVDARTREALKESCFGILTEIAILSIHFGEAQRRPLSARSRPGPPRALRAQRQQVRAGSGHSLPVQEDHSTKAKADVQYA